jgi:hypothetical protein
MTFTPPAFEKLRVNTLNLEIRYSNFLKRYRVVDEQVIEKASVVQQSSLDVLIARTNEVITCKTNRTTQRDIFNLLVNELRQIPKEDGEKIKQGTLFLLGALIHRYFRLLNEYDTYNGYAYWTIWGTCNITDCKLFLAIRKALQFRELDGAKKKFKERDLETLDVVTIITALEVFRDNMFLEDERNIPRYMKYPHFAKDDNFKQYLQDIITFHKKRGAAVLKRFKAIAFLQSLADEIEKERQQVEKDIQKWCKGVAKDYKDFAAFKALGDTVINESIIKYVESETSRNVIFDLFYTPLINGNLDSTDHSTLFTKMKEAYQHKCSYMLFGGYALLLQKSRSLDSNLLFFFQQALNIDGTLKELTNEDMRNGVRFLREFIDMVPDAALNCEFFEGKRELDALIERSEKELTELVAVTKDEAEAVVLTS